eukprot:GILK01002835.1.p1 GENE.GILK01002835.1~~GILK01002835.1.p1  ORF type:complete len:348 (+),score=83.40 GILK01002835.1:48-1091(+)
MSSSSRLFARGFASAAAPRVHLSPAVRRLVEQFNVAIGNLRGSGGKGRILKGDVLQYLNGAKSTTAASTQPPAPAAARSQPAPSVSGSTTSAIQRPTQPRFEDLPLSNIRKIIASRLSESKRTIPHLYVSIECPMDKLLSLRKKLKEEHGVTASVNDFIVKAAAVALTKVPQANVSYINGQVTPNATADISVAVATEGGLITPIVKNANTKSIQAISAEIRDLATRAKANKLKPQEFQGGSFTISNLGMFGIDTFSAVINPPQCCILAVSRSEKRITSGSPAVDFWNSTDEILPASADSPLQLPPPTFETVMTVTLSSDRRGVDDVTAAKFLNSFKQIMAEPMILMS